MGFDRSQIREYKDWLESAVRVFGTVPHDPNVMRELYNGIDAVDISLCNLSTV